MAARWMWPTRKSMKMHLGGQGRVAEQRLSANPVRVAGRKRHARAVRQPDGCLHHRGNYVGENRAAGLTQGHAVSGRPTVFRLPTLETGAGHRRGSVMARQEEHAPDMRKATSRRELSEPDLSGGTGLAAKDQRDRSASD